MPNWQWAILAWGCLWALQSIGVWFQMKGYTKAFNQLKSEQTKGFIGTGHAPGRLKGGTIAIVIASPDLIITKAIAMSGFTIFSKFQPIPDFVGLSLVEARAKIESDHMKASLGAALNKAFDQINGLQKRGGQATQSRPELARA